MPANIDLYTPRTLLEVVRSNPPTRTFFRDTFFTNTRTFPTERVDLDIVKGDRQMAAFVAPRVGGAVIRMQGYKTESYAPPLINPYDITTADMLMTRLPGEDLYSGRTPMDRAAERLTWEYNKLQDADIRREEWMCATALMEGKIPIVGKGVNEVIDFNHTLRKELTGDDVWGGSKSAILDNLEDWVDEVEEEGLVNPDMLILGSAAARLFRDDQKIRDLLDNRRIEYGEIAPRDLPNGVRYIGHLAAPSLDIYTYSERYLDDWTDPEKPTVKPLIEPGKILLASSQSHYTMAYGMISYIDDATKNWVTAEAPRVLTAYVAHNPDRRFLELKSKPLPIPDKADSWLVADVIEAG